MQTGNIGVTTENIFPVIKKFLYSDEEIFLREIISNAVDASKKLRVLASTGEYNGNVDDLCINVYLNEDEKTITVRDNGIGMTGEEIEKYINQIAFSGAEDFINKFKTEDNIIGHFGLGFYSSYIVSDTVEIITKSYKENAVAQHWVCDGSPAFTLEDTEKDTIGTDIVMHISDEFIESYIKNSTKVENILKKYARFMEIPIYFYPPVKIDENATEEDKAKAEKEPQRVIITDIIPLWKKNPTEISDADYIDFYKHLYPEQDDPLFWIHLNVDFPFNLTGILYFPKVNGNVDIMRNKVYLYCNQVYVTDHVRNILPDYLTLLHGVIDSPNIPLNVSRSYLQGDANVKQISKYIANKVAAELNTLIKSDRTKFEEKWESIKLFINYGVLTQEGYYKKLKDVILVKDVDNKYYTLPELHELIKESQKDKHGKVIYLYAIDKTIQYTFIEAAKNRGYKVIMMDDNLTTPLINLFERETPDTSWVRVDANTLDKLIERDLDIIKYVDERTNNILTTLFANQAPEMDDVSFSATTEVMTPEDLPIVLTSNEWTRRIKEMYAHTGMGQMKLNFVMNINTEAPIIKTLLDKFDKKHADKYNELSDKIIAQEKLIADLKAAQQPDTSTGNDSSSVADTTEIDKANEELNNIKDEQRNIVNKFGEKSDLVHQLIDIALLQCGMLTGEKLLAFLKRSVKVLK